MRLIFFLYYLSCKWLNVPPKKFWKITRVLKKNKYKRKVRWFANYFQNTRFDSDNGNKTILKRKSIFLYPY